MAITDPHDRELAQALWSALPELCVRYGALYGQDLDGFFRLAQRALETRDTHTVIAMGQVLADKDALSSKPARKLSFASRFAAGLIEYERFSQAVAVLSDPRVADTTHPKYWRQLALAFAGVGQTREALRAVEQSRRLSPDSEDSTQLAADLEAMQALQDRVGAAGWTDLRRLADLYMRFGLRGPARSAGQGPTRTPAKTLEIRRRLPVPARNRRRPGGPGAGP